MAFAISIKPNLSSAQKAMIALRATQVPFASAMALTKLAQGVAKQEQVVVDKTFDHPTAFTEKAFRVEVATKKKQFARVAIKDRTNANGGQAAYLDPYIFGGERFLGTKKGMLAPRGINLNQYGNLTRGTMKRLSARADVYIGRIQVKSGKIVSGVWQWAPLKRGAKIVSDNGGTPKARPGMKLLIRFEDTTPAPKHFPFFESAIAYVNTNACREFDAALCVAMASAKR